MMMVFALDTMMHLIQLLRTEMDLNEIYTELWGNNSMVVYHPSLNDDGEPTILATAYASGYGQVFEIKLYSFAIPTSGRTDVHVIVRELCFDFIKQEMNKGLE
jgi:hypothetical protein